MAPDASIPETPSAGGVRWLLPVVALLALVGVALSIELTRVHVLLHTDPDYVAGCDISAQVSCSAVELSPYAMAAGVPLSVWGLLGYLVLLGVVLSGWRAASSSSWPRGALLGLALLFSLMSAYNAYISLVMLGKVCPFCVGTYVVNWLLLPLTLVAAWRGDGGPLKSITGDLALLRSRLATSLGAGAAVAAIAGALIGLYPHYWEQAASPGTPGANQLTTGTTPAGSHWIGASNPAVTIEEFSDYECPFCARSHAVARAAVAAKPDELRLVHRHYPLDIECNDELDRPFHRYACLAAKSTECAGEQGKYWEFNDRVFASQKKLNASSLERIADELGLDRSALDACIKGSKVAGLIDHDVEAGAAFQATGTPFFVVNGKLHMGGVTAEKLDELIRDSPFAAAPVDQARTARPPTPTIEE